MQRGKVGQQLVEVAEGPRRQRLGHALAQLVACQTALDVVLLQLGNHGLAVGVARAQVGGWPRAARTIHQVTIYRAPATGVKILRSFRAGW